MNISKSNLNLKHIAWCNNFMKEQVKSARLIRKYLKESRINNPLSNDTEIDNILKKYEKSFWG